MNRRTSMVFTIAAVAAMGATLFGGTFTQSAASGAALGKDTEAAHQMGGLELVMPSAFASTHCENVDTMGRNVVEANLVGVSVELPIMGGKTYSAMTFNEQVPGPTVRATQGDVIKMTLTVPEDELTAHGNDMHASQISGANFGAVQPGESKTYCFIAEVPGVFKYHCSGIDLAAMDQHVFSGMYGITIVDPLDGYKKLMTEKTMVENGRIKIDRQFVEPDALEFQLQYNELYLNDDGGYDMNKMFDHDLAQTVVNGLAFSYLPNEIHNTLINGDPRRDVTIAQVWNSSDLNQYQAQLLFVEEDQHVRFFVQNQGRESVFWHIVGEILDRVTQGNRVQAQGTETWLLGGSQNMIVDVVFDEPGHYIAVNHDYAAIYQGAATVIVVGDPFGLNPVLMDLGVLESPVPSYAHVMGNPTDAIPPMGAQSVAHPAQILHGLYTDDRAAQIQQETGALTGSAVMQIVNDALAAS